MYRAKLSMLGLVGSSLLMAVGCQPSSEEMEAMMKQPPRPAELERLEAFVGTWKADFEVKMPGSEEAFTSQGTNTSEWAADKWMLVEHWEHDMGKTDKMKGVTLTWWDAHRKKYRMTWTDNYGGRVSGTMVYDAEEKTWKTKAKGRDGMTGEGVVETWTAKFTDPSTMEWTWAQYDGLGLFKHVEVTGTSKRQ